MQGAYFYQALLCASPMFHAFAKKGTKPLPYPEEPLQFEMQSDIREERVTKESNFAEKERMKAVIFFKNWARANKDVGSR